MSSDTQDAADRAYLSERLESSPRNKTYRYLAQARGIAPVSDECNRYEPPLVQGGQGRSAEEVVSAGRNVFWMVTLFALAMIVGLCPQWLSFSVTVLLAVGYIVRVMWTNPVTDTDCGTAAEGTGDGNA